MKRTAGSDALNGIGINKMATIYYRNLLVATNHGLFLFSDHAASFKELSVAGTTERFITHLRRQMPSARGQHPWIWTAARPPDGRLSGCLGWSDPKDRAQPR